MPCSVGRRRLEQVVERVDGRRAPNQGAQGVEIERRETLAQRRVHHAETGFQNRDQILDEVFETPAFHPLLHALLHPLLNPQLDTALNPLLGDGHVQCLFAVRFGLGQRLPE